MKFLADENFPDTALRELRAGAYDVSSVSEDNPGIGDEEVAGLCDGLGRVLLTFDKDFGELVFRRGLVAELSVVLFRIDPEPVVVAEILRSLVDTGILTAGVFCVVARNKVRVRPLRAIGVID